MYRWSGQQTEQLYVPRPNPHIIHFAMGNKICESTSSVHPEAHHRTNTVACRREFTANAVLPDGWTQNQPYPQA